VTAALRDFIQEPDDSRAGTGVARYAMAAEDGPGAKGVPRVAGNTAAPPAVEAWKWR